MFVANKLKRFLDPIVLQAVPSTFFLLDPWYSGGCWRAMECECFPDYKQCPFWGTCLLRLMIPWPNSQPWASGLSHRMSSQPPHDKADFPSLGQHSSFVSDFPSASLFRWSKRTEQECFSPLAGSAQNNHTCPMLITSVWHWPNDHISSRKQIPTFSFA